MILNSKDLANKTYAEAYEQLHQCLHNNSHAFDYITGARVVTTVGNIDIYFKDISNDYMSLNKNNSVSINGDALWEIVERAVNIYIDSKRI